MISNSEPSNYYEDFQEVVIQHKYEVEKTSPYNKECYDVINSIYDTASLKGVNEFNLLLAELTPYLTHFVRTSNNLTNMSSIILDTDLEIKPKYYVACFMYLLYIEGSYWSFLKILYALQNLSKGTPIPFGKIEKTRLSDIKKKFVLNDPSSEILFKNWFDGNLRNAIAHADMSYNDEQQIMTFSHYHQGILKYQKQYTYEEFVNIYRGMSSVAEISFEYILLLRVRDICVKLSRPRNL